MTDYGELYLDTEIDGAVLSLGGVVDNVRSRRVEAGPRRGEGYRQCGRVQVYTAGKRVARLYATPRDAGRLELLGWTFEGAGQVSEPFAAVLAGCAREELTSRRWGFLRVSAIGLGGAPTDVVQIDTDASHHGGSIRLYGPYSGMAAVLEIDDQSPFLYMTDGHRSITISPRGIEQSPDKSSDEVGEAGLRDVDPGHARDPREGLELNFVATHPDDPGLQIHYNVIEGPEVGVFVRGTAKLADGRAIVALPDHFRHVASESGLTVQLTPRSGDSEGVAAERLTVSELEIVELRRGRGRYDVDYQVQGIRRGREGFEVVRPKRAGVVRTVTVRRSFGAEDGIEQDDDGE